MSASLMKLSAPASLRQAGGLFASRFSSLSGVVLPQGGTAFYPGDFPFLWGFFYVSQVLLHPR